MSVYVDEMRPCVRTGKWRYDRSCHLTADSVEELQEFARLIYLSRYWFQNKPELPHYDLTYGVRIRAVAYGTIEVDSKKNSELMRKNRQRKGANHGSTK